MISKKIVWIIIDSLVTDLIDDKTMPFVYNLLNQNVWFKNCFTTIPFSRGSFYAALSGKYGEETGVNQYKPLKENCKSNIQFIQKFLNDRGYNTCRYSVDGKLLCPEIGFNKHFSSTKFELNKFINEFENFDFMFYHYNDLHECCYPADRTSIGRFVEPYKGAMRKVDYDIENLNKKIEEKFGKDIIIILSSDHGINFIDGYHGRDFKETVIKTLLGFINIGYKKEIKQLTRIIDIAPTIIDLLGYETNQFKMENSLINLIEDKKNILDDKEIFLETGGAHSSPNKPEMWGVRTSKYKIEYINNNYIITDVITNKIVNNRKIKDMMIKKMEKYFKEFKIKK